MSNYGYINRKDIEAKADKICNCIGNGKYNTAKEIEVNNGKNRKINVTPSNS